MVAVNADIVESDCNAMFATGGAKANVVAAAVGDDDLVVTCWKICNGFGNACILVWYLFLLLLLLCIVRMLLP